jgi:hypothetical protein
MLTFYHSQFPDFQLEKAHNLLTEMNLSAKQKIKELIGYVLFPAENPGIANDKM